jgi:SIR2-like domain
MLDPTLRLALALNNNKGAYALLVGSGVSRAAGIPTGWEIVIDLVRQLARLEGAEMEDDPLEWYRRSFGEEPHYSKLLERLATPPTERARLLRPYFEPDEQELEQGLKSPTAAHRAIAELVARGYIKLIITTNFDRLIERELDKRGIVPTVIATTDAILGAPPVAQTRCTIIKVNGDYLDTRIKNTAGELESYEPPMNALLDRVLDEFGLVVLGWSAEWDIALRAALERNCNRRYATYWALRRDQPTDLEKSLMDLRGAERVRIADADSFLTSVVEKVSALEDIQAPHPISAQVAVATLKTYLAEPRHRIRLRDFVREETNRLVETLSPQRFPESAEASGDQLQERLTAYEAATDIVPRLVATGCFWGDHEQTPVWVETLEHLADAHSQQSMSTIWQALRRYPALLVFYGGGITSVMSSRYGTLAALMVEARVSSPDKELPAALVLNTWKVFPDFQARLPGMATHFTPLSEHLFKVLRDPLRDFVSDDRRYENAFDRFEYLLALIHADLKNRPGSWKPMGCFGWRHRFEAERHVSAELAVEAEQKGKGWEPLAAGLFGGSAERFKELNGELQATIRNLPW